MTFNRYIPSWKNKGQTSSIEVFQASQDFIEIGSVRRELIPTSYHQHLQLNRTILVYKTQIRSTILHGDVLHQRMRVFHVGVRRDSRRDFPKDYPIWVHISFEGIGFIVEDFWSHPMLRIEKGIHKCQECRSCRWRHNLDWARSLQFWSGWCQHYWHRIYWQEGHLIKSRITLMIWDLDGWWEDHWCEGRSSPWRFV